MAKSKDKLIAQGDKLIRKGKTDQAISAWEEALSLTPRDTNLLNKVGDAYAKLNNNSKAVENYLKVGDHFAKDGFFLKAIAMFKKINKVDPSRLEIYDRLADLYHKQGLVMEAKSQFQVLADYHIKQGETGKAIDVYLKIADIDPNNINVQVKLADLFVQAKRMDEALDRYEVIGNSLTSRGHLDEAAQVYQKALQLNPGSPKVLEALAGVLQKKNDPAGALGILEQATQQAPDNAKLLLLLGRTYSELGRNGDADGAFARAAEAAPGDPDVMSARADVSLRRGDADGAFAILGPIADQAANAGEPRKAVEMLAPILKIQGQHVGTLEAYVRYYQKAGEETTVINHRNLLAEAFMARQEWERAAEVLQDLVRIEPENSQHQEKLDLVRSKMGLRPTGPPGAAPQAPPPPTMDFDETGGFLSNMDGGVVEEPAIEIDLDQAESIEIALEPDAGELGEAAAGGLEASGTEGLDSAENRDFIAEHLTEAEVFAKYGLVGKAIEQYEAILERDPKHTTALSRIVDLCIEEGRQADAESYAARFSQVADPDDSDAVAELEQKLAAKGWSLPAGAGAAADEVSIEIPEPEAEPDVAIELDLEDEVEIEPGEEIAIDSSEELAAEPEIELNVQESIELDPSEELDLEPDEDLAVELEEELDLEPDEDVAVDLGAEIELESDDDAAVDLAAEIDLEPDEDIAAELEQELAESVETPFEGAEELSADAGIAFEAAEDESPGDEAVPVELDLEDDEEIALEIGDDDVEIPQEPEATLPVEPAEPKAPAGRKARADLSDVEALVGVSPSRAKPSPGDITDKFLEDLGMGGLGKKKKKKKTPSEPVVEAEAPVVEPEVAAEPSPLEEVVADTPVEVPVGQAEEADGLAGLADELAAEAGPAMEEIGEIDFYIDQGLLDEARKVLERLEARFPAEGELAARRERIEAAVARPKEKPVRDTPDVALDEAADSAMDLDLGRAIEEEMAKLEEAGEAPQVPSADSSDLDEGNLFADEDSFFDLAAELEDEFAVDEEGATDGDELGTEEASLEDIFKEFKKGVEQQLDAEDFDTHYNLGIAYKEMGLVDEAIGEFQIASKDPKRAIECCSMLGLCFLEKGMPQLAIKWYRKGLENPDITEGENLGLLYDLGNVYQEVGDLDSAYRTFLDLYGIDAGYRDISFRVKELKEALQQG